MTDTVVARRPRRLIAICALIGMAFLRLPLTRGESPFIPQVPLPIFDTFFGIGGFIIMGLACVWLWRRRRRDIRALIGATVALTGIITLTVVRLVFFVQADYDRGRLPFAVGAALIGLATSSGLWWVSARRND